MKKLYKKVIIVFVQILFILGLTSNTNADDDRDTMCVNGSINTGKCRHDAAGDHYCDYDADFLMDCWEDINMS